MTFVKILISVCTLILTLAQAAELMKPAPPFSLRGQDGKTHSLSDFRGKIVVLEWFNPGCPFVRKFYDAKKMQQLQEKYREKGVVWLSLNSSAKGKQGHIYGSAAAKEMMAKEGSHAQFLLLDSDGQVGKLYQAQTTPHMYIINQSGVLVYEGAIDSIASTDQEDIKNAENYLDLALTALLAKKEIKKKKTRPYGCSVKY